IIADVFENFGSSTVESVDEVDYYLFTVSKSYIGRVSGEDVGTYEYTVNTAMFDLGENFTVSVQTTQVFTIVQRTVVLNVGSQSTVLLSDTTPVYSEIIPSYMLSNVDMHLAAEIEVMLSGKLSIDPTKLQTTTVPEGYTAWEWHTILLAGDAGNDNICFELGDDTVYIIYFADAILIKLKSGVTFSAMFGTLWTESLVTFSTDKFELTSKQEIPAYDSISWTVSLRGVDANTYPSVGSYAVIISDIKLIKDGAEIEDCFVIADNFNFTFTAAPVVVRPTASVNGSFISTKTYGEPESVFGIGFEIVTVGGRPVEDYLAAGYTYEQIYNQISGEFVRGWFASTGDFREFGTRNSAATDANGFVIGTDGDYYAFYEGSAFTSSDRNFSVVTELDDTVRFHILPKEITLDAANFVGVSKSYDGSTNVNYNRVTAYSIADQLAFTSDDLKLAFEAQYNEIGSIEKETPVRIIFTNLRLEGRSVGNYVLTLIVNTSSTSHLYVGDEPAWNAEVSDAVRVEIECIYNNLENPAENEQIFIYMGTIALYKSDFTVTKAYDNSRVLGDGSISIAERSDDQNRGTSTLYQVWKRGEMQILEGSGAYNGTSVSNNYVINTLLLFFPIQGATGLRVVNGDAYLDPDGEYNDPDVKVTATDKGIRVELTNIRASITKRELNVDSFVMIAAVDRAYNSEAGVSTTYEFSSTALAPGDTPESVGLTLRARIDDTNFDQGTHRIAFMPVGTTSDDTILRSANYSINIDALNSEYYADKAKTVNISRAKLIPNGVFQNKEYDGTTDVEFTHGSGENDLTTLQYAEQLMHELVTFTVSGEVTYNLSANGKLNENVTANGWHNVLVSGLKIEEAAGNNYLRNYEIYGSRYVGESYRTVGAVTSGTTINDYEILDAMQLTKRKIQILVNNINIKEKVYDGTRDAVITVSLEGSHIVEGHDKFLEIQASGTFAKSIVNTNVAVTIGNIRLVAKEGGEEYLNNYLLEEYTERRAADIVPRPVSVTASLGTKTYDGLAKIPNNLISIDVSGLFENEAAGYAAQASGGAYFMDKNVLLDENGNVSGEKLGAVFNPELKNNRGKSNYAPAYATTVKDGDDYIAYVLDGVLHYKEQYDGDSKEVVYYYALPTVDKYILLSDSTLAEEAFKAGAIVGCYTFNKQEVYAVKSTYKGNVSGNLSAPVTYITGKGMIKQKNIYVSPNGIEIINNSVLTKMYDRTDKFYGTEGVDYQYNNEKGIVGLVKGDDVTLSGIQGKFDSADTTANYVIFTASGIGGTDKDNYIVDMSATSARRAGSITKRTIKSTLEDGTMVYGDVVGDIVGNITYKILGNQLINVNGEFVNKEYDLELWNGGLFMQLDKFAEMMGLTVADYKDIINVRYLKDGEDNFYEISSSDANWDKAYLMLSSINSLPTAKAVFNLSKPAAGTIANSYTLVGGNAINYNFQPVYMYTNSSSKMEVVRKNLFIATNGEEYTLVYGENAPSVNLLYLDINGNYGIASSETLNSVFGEYSPIVKFGVFNVNTNEFTTQISKYPTITLGEGEMYVVYVDGLKDKDGNQLTDEEIERVIPNYTINFGKAFAVVKDKVVMTYAGFEFTATASELFVRLPEVTDVELGEANGNEYHVTYNGTNLAGSALVGDIRAYDEIGILGENGISNAAVNAGVYEGHVMIVRSVAIDENDPNGYFVTWVSPVSVTFVVDKASPNLTVEGRSKYFDNEKYEYTVSGG
ncbi:MAG: hypothetical protein K2J16_05020, partial [Clostridia bacterium]|nr:hypothetical protein [Clostridia bacterium]